MSNACDSTLKFYGKPAFEGPIQRVFDELFEADGWSAFEQFKPTFTKLRPYVWEELVEAKVEKEPISFEPFRHEWRYLREGG
jgi:hypothetical protein